MNLYLGLVHHPIKNKNDQLVTTSVTNMDIHDISRSCRTYGVKQYHIITPLDAQQQLLSKILGHWEEDKNGAYNPDRQDALAVARLSRSLEVSLEIIEKTEGVKPKVYATGANFEKFDTVAKEVKSKAEIDKCPIFLIFGTGWGLHSQALELADYYVEPIFGQSEDGYNHLSVRSAVAIYLDRITQG